MLSIVIPVYNHDVRPLVTTLMKQCNKLDIPYQILCFDDGSQQKYRDLNKELAFRINVNYTELNENLGRSRI
jgi:glycosyltransferase involved in cell wall biosynthesis